MHAEEHHMESKTSNDSEFSTYSRTRGHSLKLAKKCTRLDLRQHFFSERIINIWNQLDDATVSASSVNRFKHHLEILHKDGSHTHICQSTWSSRLSQSPPGEASSGKTSGKTTFLCVNGIWKRQNGSIRQNGNGSGMLETCLNQAAVNRKRLCTMTLHCTRSHEICRGANVLLSDLQTLASQLMDNESLWYSTLFAVWRKRNDLREKTESERKQAIGYSFPKQRLQHKRLQHDDLTQAFNSVYIILTLFINTLKLSKIANEQGLRHGKMRRQNYTPKLENVLCWSCP